MTRDVYGFATLVLYFAGYAFLGWVVEVLYVFARTQKLENRGFLTLPFLPIYGVGAIVLVTLVLPFVKNPFLVFAISVVAASVLEYVTSFLMQKLFHVTLWDYTGRPFNLHGRICLQNSLLFGGLGLLLVYVLHPVLSMLILGMPHAVTVSLASALAAVLLVDAANSFAGLAKVRPVLDDMKGTLDQAHAKIEADARRRHAEHGERRGAFDALRTRTAGRLGRVFSTGRSTKAAPATP